MDSDRALGIELRRALDEVLPPAPWLEAAVSEDLGKRRGARESMRIRLALPRPAIQLAAGVLIMVLAAAAVASYVELRSHAPQSEPAGALSIQAYQAMVGRDEGRLPSSFACLTLQSVCPAPGKPWLTAVQRWLDDLNSSVPPARFAVIDVQLRLHLAANISFTNATFAAYAAQDQNALDRANYAASREADWFRDIGANILASQEGTAAGYTTLVRTQEQMLAACISCQTLESTSPIDCAQMQSDSCESDVAVARTAIERFEAALVRVAAPSSIAAHDAILQTQLAQADTALLAIANAQAMGGQAGFDSGLRMFQQALPAINADVATILGP